MTAPESLDQALRDGWGEDDQLDEREVLDPKEVSPESTVEVVSERVRRRYRRAA
jgi:hypothetical protein